MASWVRLEGEIPSSHGMQCVHMGQGVSGQCKVRSHLGVMPEWPDEPGA